MPEHAHLKGGHVDIKLHVPKGVVNHGAEPVELINNPRNDRKNHAVINNLHTVPEQLPTGLKPTEDNLQPVPEMLENPNDAINNRLPNRVPSELHPAPQHIPTGKQ